jgi:hypothetical protein
MRLRLAWVLFALGVAIAGCGGGGTSSLVPSSGGNTGSGGNAPSSTKTTHASISLYVPPANKQASSRKPFYISPNTQSFGIVVLPYTSPVPSPVPTTNIQIFPVTTPSPCAIASPGGGETCTFTVTAPVGNDLFVVAAFATAAPSGNVTPLSAFVSGEVAVSLNPSPGASPLAFTLNGIVYSVAVAVASPDPGNTPNTQVFTVGVPTSAPLGVTAYDASGNLVMSDATTPYYNPIVIQASPAGEGLTLSFVGSSSCGSSASGATATLNCAGDLGSVQVNYNGEATPDPNDHLLDNYSVYSTTQPNPSPSPANYVLASNILSWQLASNSYVGSNAFLRLMSNGQFFYLAYLESPVNGWVSGTFAPATETAGAQNTITDGNLFSDVALAPDGSYWVADSSSGKLECFTSIGATTPALSNVDATESYDGNALEITSIGIDSSGNIWYAGWDSDYTGGGPPAPPDFAGYFTSANCADPGTPLAQFALTNAYGGYSPKLALNPTGGIAVVTGSDYLLSGPNYNSVWEMTTGSTSPIAGTPTNNHGSVGVAIAADGAGTVYAAFRQGLNPTDVEELASGASAFDELLSLPPSSGSLPSPMPSGLSVFAPSGSPVDRALYADEDYEALGLIESIPASPMPILVSLPNSAYVLDSAYSTKGGEFVLDMDASENLNIVRIMPTKTWSVPNVSLNSACGATALLTILERGDSGPFTLTIPPASGVSATQIPGADHDFYLSVPEAVTPFSAQVTDAHGRTETFNVTSTPSSVTCGLAHRRLITHHL